MNEIEPTWGRVARVWWFLIWRSAAAASLFTFVAILWIRIVDDIVYVDQRLILFAIAFSLVAAFAYGNFLTVRVLLKTRFPGFRIAMVQN